ncbi:MAG: transcriptional repressor [Spirochaetia bacterium]|jgi:Fur family peroxide stress response transcriptional regulator|nr:transcriptional repressor [Spirochaetia bacterium]
MKVDEAELERRLEAFKAAARAAGVKLTHQRLEIFREIAGSLEHPDAETVFRAVQARMPTVSLDTVYRTLWMLNELGLVSTLGPRRENIRFDANLRPHHHYVCVRCGLTRDFEAPVFDEQAISGAVKAFGSVVASQVEVRGICEKCAKADIRATADAKARSDTRADVSARQ